MHDFPSPVLNNNIGHCYPFYINYSYMDNRTTNEPFKKSNERNFQNTADIQTFNIIVDILTDDTEAKKSVI